MFNINICVVALLDNLLGRFLIQILAIDKAL